MLHNHLAASVQYRRIIRATEDIVCDEYFVLPYMVFETTSLPLCNENIMLCVARKGIDRTTFCSLFAKQHVTGAKMCAPAITNPSILNGVV